VTSDPGPLKPFDIVIVPFPFAERDAVKRRPALALSSAEFIAATGTVVVAMITTSAHDPWPHDVPVADLRAAGLTNPCVVRWKLATRDVRFIIRRAGSLSARDRAAARVALRRAIG
jgi:mRNA interferase MazF